MNTIIITQYGMIKGIIDLVYYEVKPSLYKVLEKLEVTEAAEPILDTKTFS
jgi:hypothetical protein